TQTSRRVIEYTYLPRAGMKLEGRELALSIFLPQSKTFKKVVLKIPEIEVVGTASTAKVEEPKKSNESTVAAVPSAKKIEKKLTPLSPFGTIQRMTRVLSSQQLLLAIACLIFLLSLASNLTLNRKSSDNNYWQNYRKYIAGGFDYKNYLHFLAQICPKDITEIENIF